MDTHATAAPEFGAELARAYARHWRGHSARMLAFMPQIFDELGIKARPEAGLLDIACGEGTFSLGMAQRGWMVTGVDLSESMLERARTRERSSAKQSECPPVTWLRQDIRDLEVQSPAGLATCWFNSLNYLLTPAEVAATFSGVHQALQPGGWFLFDVYTRHGLSVDWASRAWIAVDEPDLYMVADTQYHPAERLATVHFTGFRREKDHYVRFDERHSNRAYEWRELRELLADAGFTNMRAFTVPGFESPDERTERMYVAAQAG